jgi:hypothetical protein
MTPKQNVLRFVATLPNDVSYERILYHIGVMQAVEQGEADAAAGRVIDHDKLMAELDAEDAQDQARLVDASKRTSARHQGVHRPKHPANRHRVHKRAEARAGKTKKVS